VALNVQIKRPCDEFFTCFTRLSTTQEWKRFECNKFYIFSLAFGDLLVILICVPLAGLPYVFEHWPWGDGNLGNVLCRGSEFAKDISIGVSIFTLVALASDRYTGIVNPLKKLQARSKMILVIIVVIWSLAVLFALPAVLVSKVINTNDIMYCSPFGNFGKTYSKYMTIIKATIYYFLPLTIIGILYTLMAKKLQNSAREVQSIAGAGYRLKNPQAQNRRHVARMVIVFILVFIICFLPHWIFQLWFWLSEDAESNYDLMWHYVRIIGFCLYFINSTLNPLALYFVSSLFRQHFHNYLCCQSNTVEHGVTFSRGQSTYKRSNGKTPTTYIESSNYSMG
ncbi:CLUMA_CG021248, isoform B, partial [Clunio marinus]